MNRNPNNFNLEEKKEYIDTFKNFDFDKLFNIGSEFRDYIHGITFSNDKIFSFVCMNYSGNLNIRYK